MLVRAQQYVPNFVSYGMSENYRVGPLLIFRGDSDVIGEYSRVHAVLRQWVSDAENCRA